MKADIVVKTIIFNSKLNRFLIVQRCKTDEVGADTWENAGGNVECHETLEEAVRRELKEETGIEETEIKGVAYVTLVNVSNPYLIIAYLCETKSENVILSNEHQAYLWADEDECRKSAFPCPRDFAMGDIPSRIGCIVQKEDDAETIAKAFQLPKRIVLACVHGTVTEGKLLLLPEREEHMTILTVKPGQTWESFAQPQVLMMLNSYFGPLYPGMKLLSIRT